MSKSFVLSIKYCIFHPPPQFPAAISQSSYQTITRQSSFLQVLSHKQSHILTRFLQSRPLQKCNVEIYMTVGQYPNINELTQISVLERHVWSMKLKSAPYRCDPIHLTYHTIKYATWGFKQRDVPQWKHLILSPNHKKK